jgi:hypothetical protein
VSKESGARGHTAVDSCCSLDQLVGWRCIMIGRLGSLLRPTHARQLRQQAYLMQHSGLRQGQHTGLHSQPVWARLTATQANMYQVRQSAATTNPCVLVGPSKKCPRPGFWLALADEP